MTFVIEDFNLMFCIRAYPGSKDQATRYNYEMDENN